MIGRFLKGVFDRQRASEAEASDGHAVIVHLPLKTGGMGSPDEQADVLALCEQLEEAIAANGVGEFDGHEFGQGESVLFAYGRDANVLYETMQALLSESAIAVGGFAIKRFGPAADANSREIKVAW